MELIFWRTSFLPECRFIRTYVYIESESLAHLKFARKEYNDRTVEFTRPNNVLYPRITTSLSRVYLAVLFIIISQE